MTFATPVCYRTGAPPYNHCQWRTRIRDPASQLLSTHASALETAPLSLVTADRFFWQLRTLEMCGTPDAFVLLGLWMTGKQHLLRPDLHFLKQIPISRCPPHLWVLHFRPSNCQHVAAFPISPILTPDAWTAHNYTGLRTVPRACCLLSRYVLLFFRRLSPLSL